MSEPTTRQLNVPIPDDLHHRLRVTATNNRTELKKLVPELLELGLQIYEARKESSAD